MKLFRYGVAKRLVLSLAALAALGGCVAVPYNSGYYDQNSAYYGQPVYGAPVYAGPPVYVAPAVNFGFSYGHGYYGHGRGRWR
jgi:hypothetical protein